ncbi:sodium-translocating pyrophosphatase [Candidatus Woesebacteria bacterium RIFCSPHIGHO2_02_FULL_42_20]|uniref:K(+)-insensitive pyrophosphate-energized proton pump n=1 Tax=Candidatus Woesebacteria bacterium RIFCSPHIGHO2_12_FULL_41_24 TaxID=1802510 RepID=A0A1F8ASD7_9BACT|nr:MAG: sodium-translocating pyrophosphatase [Candidatus Woesebacteria bacterium RBG_16_41_13]OGM30521.1 MAG: sodium-translocating pyrophosphatase [Candidatus Woesebacteria bacterium RIFCSPHIGHO2_01_FULL_42_80]OGM35930.1 MAG: sodium-translocating pyrophosphatase [Candidatus Woesebacteria bacterium RIFCSPHIGHO2_02_FULL_42_20]OGM54178.1 MAG: sodium-translocating pyrophosphatase [Candidatus Woesebacteria bacterium RIFCSPHIGHO2_12_FULL_41_24]OGM66526.1 MAG: sodium-translocating pyrophosphatase [Can
MDTIILLSIGASLVTIFYSAYLIRKILSLPAGDQKMLDISQAIFEGAQAYLKRQYKTVFVVAAVLLVILLSTLGVYSAIGFALGALASASAGFVGMNVAVRSNSRTTEAAKRGLGPALAVAFKGGSVTGLLVASLALLSISLILALSKIVSFDPILPMVSLGFGGSLISVFARLGGGIYTKGADVGTDMVGKIEKGIPEDDPRNPGVIADLVGDNVGDDAGMAADLFETYVVTTVSAILLAKLIFPLGASILYPLIIGAIALVGSIIGTFFVKLSKSNKIMPALYKGLASATLFSIIAFWLTLRLYPPHFPGISTWAIFFSFLTGAVITVGMVAITEYFTGKNSRAVKHLAQASESGHGTNIIAGLALSMRATFPPILLIAAAILFTFNLAGLFGVAIAAVSMLSLTGIVVAIDAFGPITDNAGGIAEMSNQSEKVRNVTDALDAVGNTTKAVTKAYAIASAGLAALVLFAAFMEELSKGSGGGVIFSISDPHVLVGLFIGASLPYLFAAFAMEAVGRAAQSIVGEIRRQFKEIKGLMKGTAKPDYGACVDIVTKAAIREMIVPAMLPVAAPIIIGLLLGGKALGGLLMGIIITGLFVAISMTTGGAAWDNAKKYIEEGNLGGKGGAAHQAAVTGDTVGDPYKDTAGPAINPMIKVANIVALLLAPFLS